MGTSVVLAYRGFYLQTDNFSTFSVAFPSGIIGCGTAAKTTPDHFLFSQSLLSGETLKTTLEIREKKGACSQRRYIEGHCNGVH